jgi:hypothetical protein
MSWVCLYVLASFHPAHCIVSLKTLTAAWISSSVSREHLKLISRWLVVWSHPNLLLKLGCFSWFSACAFSVIKTGEWSEDRSRHNFATEKSWGIPFVTQKFSRSGSLFLLDGKYEGSPADRCFKLFLSIVLSTSRPLGTVSLDPQLVCLAL